MTMISLRKNLLQAELDRIEQEAYAKSCALMNRAADLELAHRLCVLLNTGPNIETPLQPSVVFEGQTQTCRVVINAGDSGRAILLHADLQGIGWSSEPGNSPAHDVRFDGYGAIEVVLSAEQLHAYLERVEAAA